MVYLMLSHFVMNQNIQMKYLLMLGLAMPVSEHLRRNKAVSARKKGIPTDYYPTLCIQTFLSNAIALTALWLNHHFRISSPNGKSMNH